MQLHRAVFGVLSALTLAPVAAQAGASYSPIFSCTRETDGSGTCQGTYVGARSSAGVSDGVTFAMDGTGFALFTAIYNGVNYRCIQYVSAGSLDQAVWTAALSARNYFYVTWNADGTCSRVYIGNMSSRPSLPQ